MGFMDELRKLTQPYDDEDDFYEGADSSLRPQPPQASAAQIQFEGAFGGEAAGKPEPAETQTEKEAPKAQSGGLFGGFKRPGRAKPRERTVDFGGSEQQVILFAPKTFDEAGELVSHLNDRRSVVMTLEGVPTENARRLLDFLSGITYALQGKITPISAKTYFVTPQNVDVLGAQAEQPENEGQYL